MLDGRILSGQSLYVIIILGQEKEDHAEKQFLEVIVGNSPNLVKDRNLDSKDLVNPI